MSGDMRVKLFLEMVNRLSPGAKAAARDLKSIKQAAGELKREKGGEAIAAGLNKVAPAGRKAAGEIRNVKKEAKALAGERGPQQLAGGLDKASGSARRLRRELDATKRAQREFVRNHPLGLGASGLPPRDTRGRFARGGGAAGEGGGGATGIGLGAAAAAAGRSALMPLALAYGGYRGVDAAVRGTVGQSISFEKAMAEVRKKVDGMDDAAQLAAMEKSISKWAITYGRAREEVAALVAEAGAGGVSLKDMPEFTRINLAAATAWDVSASQAGNALAKIRAATQWSNAELETFVDKVNALADAGSAKEMDVVDMFQRAGAAAKAAGVDFDTSLAFLTAMNNVAIAPEVAARGFAAFSSKLRTASNQGKKVKEGLGMLGLSPDKVSKGMKTNATGTMIDVLERLEKHADKAAVAIKVFGQEWWDEVARAGQALPEIRKALDIVRDPQKYVGSAQKNLNVELETSANHLERLKALVSDVGDRFGRWALPTINAAIEKMIAGMDEIDRRAAAKQETEALAQKKSRGEALTPEERQKLANDRVLAYEVERRGNQLSAQKDYADTAARTSDASPETALDERRQLLRRQLQRQIDTLEAEQRLSPERFGRGRQQRLTALRRELADIPFSPFDRQSAARDPRRPADQDERGKADRSEVMALRERVKQLDQRIRALDELASLAKNPIDRAGFRADAMPHIARRAQAEAMIRRRLAPTVAALGNFNVTAGGAQGEGWKDSKNANWAPGTPIPATGSGLTSFGINGGASVSKGGWGKSGAAWAEKVKSDLDIDLGPAGMYMMERLTASIEAGGARAASAAAGVKTGVEAALSGADLAGAGQSAMATYAAGIRAGGDAAVAAARDVAGRVKGALDSGSAGGGRRRTEGYPLTDGFN